MPQGRECPSGGQVSHRLRLKRRSGGSIEQSTPFSELVKSHHRLESLDFRFEVPDLKLSSPWQALLKAAVAASESAKPKKGKAKKPKADGPMTISSRNLTTN